MKEGNQWRDIATAPKDQRDIMDTPAPRKFAVLLGFSQMDAGGYAANPGVCIAYWDAYYAPDGRGYYEGCSAWVIADSGETVNLHYSGEPIGWQPLPPPPAQHERTAL